MYNDFLGEAREPTKNELDLILSRPKSTYDPGESYENVRFGIPYGTIKFNEVIQERKMLISFFLKNGYDNAPLSKLNPKFRKFVAKFRVCLDLWEKTPGTKIMDKSEIYFRCLSEGHSFTEKVKKIRSTCYRAYTTETETDIEEEYYSELYSGYNSLLHERYLIHWDDTDEVDDVKYAFMPIRKERKKEFTKLLNQFWEDLRLDEVTVDAEFDMLGSLKNTKMYDPHRKRSSLMRDFWRDDIDVTSPYYAKRVVVPTTPGSTRDTGLGDPSTILKVKQLNMLARAYSEHVPYSANCDNITANRRLKRVLRNNLFLHLDFKKFGLTFPRYMMNIMIRKMGESSGIDVSHLIIDSFHVEIGDETYQTSRGTMLGWLDAINSLCVCVILHDLAKRFKFDFVTFNDDVEISKKGLSDVKGTLSLLRTAVLCSIDFFDIPISLSKTFGSKSSVFLERYAYYEQYHIDMYKDQLSVESFSKSCITRFPWLAKMYFAVANEWSKCEYARDRCIDTCPIEFRLEEKSLPLWSGGFTLCRTESLDYSLVESDNLGIVFGGFVSNYRHKRYSKPMKEANNEKICTTIHNKVYNSYGPDCGLLYNGWTEVPISEVNEELEYVYHCAQTQCDTYQGRDKTFSWDVLDLVNKLGQGYYDTGWNQ